jgi:hypothetical protein
MARAAIAMILMLNAVCAQILKPAPGTGADGLQSTKFPQTDNTGSVPFKSLSLLYSGSAGGTVGGSTTAAGAEFMKYLPAENLMAVCNDNAKSLDLFSLATTGTLSLVNSISTSDAPQSVSVANGVLVLALDNGNRVSGTPAQIAVFDVSTLRTAKAPLFTLSLGTGTYLPDHVSFTPDGKHLCVAIEAEPDGDSAFADALGGVVVVEASDWKKSATYTTTFVTFASLSGAAAGAHFPFVTLNKTSLARDIEPEFIAYSSDSKTAYVSCQENNVVATLDLATKSFTSVTSLGLKDWGVWEADFSNKDSMLGNFKKWPNVYGMYQPDTLASYSVGGVDYIVSANEGDAKDYKSATEEYRVKKLTLDASILSAYNNRYATVSELQADAELGRLKTTATEGIASGTPTADSVSGVTYNKVYSYGGRSFSIWRASDMKLVWDSGDVVGKKAFASNMTKHAFNNDDGEADGRSDDKGAEPEGLAVGFTGGRWYLFGAAERANMIYIWDITDPAAPVYLSINIEHICSEDPYTTSRPGDPEAMQFVPAASNPTGRDLLLTVGAETKSLHVFEVMDEPTRERCSPSPPPSPKSPPASPPPVPPPPPSLPSPAAQAPCFASDQTACLVGTRGLNAGAPAAFEACFGASEVDTADFATRVPLHELVAGDVVLSASSPSGALVFDRVVVNQHRAVTLNAPLLMLEHRHGSLTMTPDHVLFLDGSWAAARDAKAGSRVSLGAGATAVVERIRTLPAAPVINPVTVGGLILVAGTGTGASADSDAPLVASTHPEWSAGFMLASPAPLPFPIFHALSYLAPASTQAYYDALLEPLLGALTPTLVVASATLPAALLGLVVFLGDLAALVMIAFVGGSMVGVARALRRANEKRSKKKMA